MPLKGAVMPVRIDKMVPGTLVALDAGDGVESATFVRVSGEGEERLATFAYVAPDGTIGYFEAHRHDGRWAYGERHTVVRVIETLAPDAE